MHRVDAPCPDHAPEYAHDFIDFMNAEFLPEFTPSRASFEEDGVTADSFRAVLCEEVHCLHEARQNNEEYLTTFLCTTIRKSSRALLSYFSGSTEDSVAALHAQMFFRAAPHEIRGMVRTLLHDPSRRSTPEWVFESVVIWAIHLLGDPATDTLANIHIVPAASYILTSFCNTRPQWFPTDPNRSAGTRTCVDEPRAPAGDIRGIHFSLVYYATFHRQCDRNPDHFWSILANELDCASNDKNYQMFPWAHAVARAGCSQ